LKNKAGLAASPFKARPQRKKLQRLFLRDFSCVKSRRLRVETHEKVQRPKSALIFGRFWRSGEFTQEYP